MTRDEIEAKLDEGRIPFVPCPHDDDGYWPAHVQLSALTVLISCTSCLAQWSGDRAEWVTSQEARERWGWNFKEPEPSRVM